jgi:integrase
MQPPPKRDWLTKRNHRRLEQFDDKKNVMALLTYPQAERARALETRDPKRRAASFERALIAALFIHAKLRIQSLRTLELKDFRKGNGGETFLFVPGEKIKTGAPLEFALPEYVSELLEEYKRDYRRQMPGAKGPYLFPGLDGKPRYHSSIRHGLSKSLRKHAGLDMNPHLFRHALTKIIVERNPELALALSRQLGHRSIETTMRYYMGTEQRAAGRHLDRVLLDLQQRGKAV